MAGITSYGAYVPYYRLPRSVINAAWGRGGGRGEKAIAGIDEDSVTIAVAAGIDCLKGVDAKAVDALFLATTTAPYKERLNATIVATALDFRRDTRNTDFVAVEIEGSYTVADDLVDYWRGHEDEFVRSWEDRFGRDAGYTQIPRAVVKEVMQKCNLEPKDIAKACIYGANARAHAGLGRALGFAPEQIQDPLLDTAGNTGAALPFMMLAAALEDAKADDRILVVTWGNGCDAIVFKVTKEIEKLGSRRGIKGHLEIKRALDNYGKYLRWRNLVSLSPLSRPAGSGVSMAAEWRERRSGLPLYGVKCNQCGTIQLFLSGSSTRAHVCLECQAKDDFEPYRFSDKTGKVVSFSHDYLGGGIDPPATRTVVDFEGGGRGLFDMVDRDPEECKVGMEVEMTFRKIRYAAGVHNYFWKCKPVRD